MNRAPRQIPRVRIRPATRADVETLARFSAAMARETEGLTLDGARLRAGTRALFDQPARGFYLVAEQKNGAGREVVGQLMVTYEWSDWRNATFWWIQSVYVPPAWRRKGVYRRMHAHVLDLARQHREVCGIRLYVERSNRIAQTAYRRAGLHPSAYRVYEEDFVLTQRLGPRRPPRKGGRKEGP